MGATVLDVAVSPDGNLIAFGGRSGLLGVVDTTGTILWKAPLHTGDSLTTAPSGKVTGVGIDGQGRILWTSHERSSDKPGVDIIDYGPDAHITGVDFMATPTGQAVVAASHDTSVRFWNANDGKFLFRPEELLPLDWEALTSWPASLPPAKRAAAQNARQRRSPTIDSLAVAPNGRWLSFVTRHEILVQWDTRFWLHDAKQRDVYGQHIQSADVAKHGAAGNLRVTAISSDGQHVFAGGIRCFVYRARDLGVIARWSDVGGGVQGTVTAAAFRPGIAGLQVAIGTVTGGLVLSDVKSGEPVEYHGQGKSGPTGATGVREPANPPGLLRVFKTEELPGAHENPVEDVCFTPDGKYLISAGSHLMVFNALFKSPEMQKKSRYGAPDKNFVRVWEVETGRLIGQLGDGQNPVLCVAVSPDAKVIYAGCDNGVIYKWAFPATPLSKN